MILKHLAEFADRAAGEIGAKEQPPPMYLYSPVRYILDITLDGKALGLRDTADKENKNGIRRLNPNIGRSSGIKPKLINDTGEYVLGIPREKSKPERIAGCHAAYKIMVREAASSLSLSEVQAVAQFIDSWNAGQPSFQLPSDYDPGAVMAVCVNGVFPTDLPQVQTFWAHYTSNQGAPAIDKSTESAAAKSGALRCLVCGKDKPVMKRMPGKIKGLQRVGGQPSGTALISANAEAFLSFGLEASLVAPTCRDCAEKFTHAINTLISTETAHLWMGPLVYIFWTRKPTRFNPFDLLNSPTPDMVRELILAVFKTYAPEVSEEADNAFYATAFSASGGRAVLRDWIETTIPDIRKNLAAYFTGHQIVDYQGQLAVFPLRRLTNATVPIRSGRPDEDKLAPQIPHALLRTALHGDPPSFCLLQAAVQRCRAEQGVSHARAALIKLVILSQLSINNQKEDFMVQLEPDLKEPAYLCGRLMAVIEATQRAALGKTNATVTDRYYGAASSAPASIFGTLLRGVRSHLSKLRKTKEGAFYALDGRLQEVLSDMVEFPKTLTLAQQGLFALGYYHQKAKDRADAQARKYGLIETGDTTVNEETEN